MQIDVLSRHLRLKNGDADHIRWRIEHGLDHFARHILGGRIVVSDMNGPKGGADKRCLVQLRLRGARRIVVEEEGADLFNVVGRAADTLAVAVARAVGKGKQGRGHLLA